MEIVLVLVAEPSNAVLLLVGLSVLENNGGGSPGVLVGILLLVGVGTARVLGSGGSVRSSIIAEREKAGNTLEGDHVVELQRGGGDTGG